MGRQARKNTAAEKSQLRHEARINALYRELRGTRDKDVDAIIAELERLGADTRELRPQGPPRTATVKRKTETRG